MKKPVIIPIIYLIIVCTLFGCGKESGSTVELGYYNSKVEESLTVKHNDNDEYSSENFVEMTNKSTTGTNIESEVANNSSVIKENNYMQTSNNNTTSEIQTEYNNIVGGIDRFKAVVIDISDSKIIVEPIDGEYERSFTELISFDPHIEEKETDNFPILSIGDTILIYYSNVDMNVSPPKLDHVYKYELINES